MEHQLSYVISRCHSEQNRRGSRYVSVPTLLRQISPRRRARDCHSHFQKSCTLQLLIANQYKDVRNHIVAVSAVVDGTDQGKSATATQTGVDNVLVDDDEYRLRDVTKRLLCYKLFPVGSYNLSAWMHAETSICAWASAHKGNDQTTTLYPTPKRANILKALDLLERLAHEASHNCNENNQHQSSSRLPNHIKITLVNSVLEGWRDYRRLLGYDATMSMEFMWGKIQLFRSLVPSLQPDATTYKLLLDFTTVGRCGGVEKNSELLEAILFNWMHEKQQEGRVHLAPINASSLQSVIQSWKLSRRPETSVRVKALSQLMQKNHPVVQTRQVRDSTNNNKIDDDYQYLLLECCEQQQEDGGFDKALSILNYMMDNDIPSLSTISLNTALVALLVLHQKSDKRGDAMLQAKALVDQLSDYGIPPNLQTYEILTKLSKSHAGNHLREFQSVLNDMLTRIQHGQMDLHQSNALVYCHRLLEILAKAGEPLEAEAVVQRMIQVGSNAKATAQVLLPNATSIALVLEAWLESGRRDAARRAQAFVGQMVTIKPSYTMQQPSFGQVYATLLSLWRNSRQRDRAVEAQAVFDRMMNQYLQQHEQQGHDQELPKADERHYIPLAHVWAEVGNVKMAESVLLEMSRSLYANNPNAQVTITLMEVWALAGKENTAERCQAMLEGMMHQYDNGYKNVKPTRALFGQLMKVWIQNMSLSSNDRADKVQACFDLMCARYHSNSDLELCPDLDTCNTLLEAWASVGQVDKVQNLWEEMISKYNLEPDFCSVAALIDAWTKSQHDNSLEQAQSLFLEHLNKYNKMTESKNKEMPKSAKHAYYSIMAAWARSGRGEAGALQVETFLEEMKLARDNGNWDLRPDARHYSIVVEAWAKAGRPEKAESLLLHVVENEHILVEPSAFRSVIDAWVETTSSSHGEERAESFLRWALSLGVNDNDDHGLTVSDGKKVLLAWSNKFDDASATEEDVERVLSFFQDVMVAHFQVDDEPDCYDILVSLIMRSNLPDKVERADAIRRQK